MINKGTLTDEFFAQPNTNCAQAVLCAFCREANLNEKTAMRVATGFGGGVQDKEICGAVSGAVMAIGLIHGQKNETDIVSKLDSRQIFADYGYA